MQHQAGSVKWFNTTKGYGFIEPETGGNDIFIHISALQRSNISTISEGQRVYFELETNKRTGKTAAANIRLA